MINYIYLKTIYNKISIESIEYEINDGATTKADDKDHQA
jgi:hypothetical protein